MMNIIVCVKQVPDTAATIKLDLSGKSISQENITYVLNPFDEYAIEEALQTKEKFGGEVTLVTMGPDRAEEALRTGLAMGADKGIHITDPQLAGTDLFGKFGSVFQLDQNSQIGVINHANGVQKMIISINFPSACSHKTNTSPAISHPPRLPLPPHEAV